MDLSPRKRAILAAIVRQHILTGEPIGSKNLIGLLSNAPSSATLRNEMSQLDEMGYLEQPHTSAGRIPTSNAYRYYVNTVLEPGELNENTKLLIDKSLLNAAADSESLPEVAAKLLSNLTGLASITATVVDKTVTVKHIELVPMSPHIAVAAVITSDGRSRSKLCRLQTPLSDGKISAFLNTVSEKIVGKQLSEFSTAYLQGIMLNAGIDALELLPLFNILFDMINDLARSLVKLNGETNLYNVWGADGRATKIASVLGHADGLLPFIAPQSETTRILFGNELGFPELAVSTLVVSQFGSKDKHIGRIGVIGPLRMSYSQIIPSVEYTAKTLSRLLTATYED